MKITFIYPAFERHANSHPELLEYVPCNEYLGSPSLGIAHLAAITPKDISVEFIDDRVYPFDPDKADADLFALSFFTPAAPRAMEIGKALLDRGKKVVMGGIFPTMMPQELTSCSTSIVIGEGEPVWNHIIQDSISGKMKAVYQADKPYDLSNAGAPDYDLYINAEHPEIRMDDYPVQLSRGCPLQCFACVIPTVMGRKIRFFNPEVNIQSALKIYSKNKNINLTEDTSFLFLSGARRKFKEFLIELWRRTGENPIKVSYMGISMPMLLSLDDEFMETLFKVGVRRFYLVCGFDDITQKGFGYGDPESLDKAAQAIKRSHDYGIEPYTSFLVGTELDNESVFDRMLEFGNKNKIDKAEFAIATPYPGTPAWHKMVDEDRIIHRKWNKYNDANVVFKPKNMSPDRLEEGYLYLWREFYKTRKHLLNLDHEQSTIQF